MKLIEMSLPTVQLSEINENNFNTAYISAQGKCFCRLIFNSVSPLTLVGIEQPQHMLD